MSKMRGANADLSCGLSPRHAPCGALSIDGRVEPFRIESEYLVRREVRQACIFRRSMVRDEALRSPVQPEQHLQNTVTFSHRFGAQTFHRGCADRMNG